MVFGAYYLTLVKDGPGEGRVFRHPTRWSGLDAGDVELHARVILRPVRSGPGRRSDSSSDWDTDAYEAIETTPGRLIFNTALPDDFPFVNDIVGKRNRPGSIVEVLASDYPAGGGGQPGQDQVARFRYAAQSGLTISIDDVKTPPNKGASSPGTRPSREGGEPVQAGHHHRDERRQKEIQIWTSANSEVGKAMEDTSTDPVQPAGHDGGLRGRELPSRSARSPA